MCFARDSYAGGFQLFASVCEPGTVNVIERFQVAGDSLAQRHQLWRYLYLCMNGEPVPDDAVNQGQPDFCCPYRADVIESTTAPDGELSFVQRQKVLTDSVL